MVTILATLAAIAMPRYGNSINRYRADSAARRLAADLVFVRETAKQRSKAFTVTFTTGTSSAYVITGLTDIDRRSLADYRVDLWKSPYNASISSLTAGGDSVLVFDGYGVPDSAASVTARVGTVTGTVTVDTSGDIQVSSP